MDNISKALIAAGLCLLFAGLAWHFTGGKIPLGKLPGDFYYESESTKVYFPFTSGLLISAIISLLSYLWRKFYE